MTKVRVRVLVDVDDGGDTRELPLREIEVEDPADVDEIIDQFDADITTAASKHVYAGNFAIARFILPPWLDSGDTKAAWELPKDLPRHVAVLYPQLSDGSTPVDLALWSMSHNAGNAKADLMRDYARVTGIKIKDAVLEKINLKKKDEVFYTSRHMPEHCDRDVCSSCGKNR
jgi:hypothetical protein